MQEKLFWVDMEKRLLNLERMVRTKGIELRKYRASYKISTYKLRTYYSHS